MFRTLKLTLQYDGTDYVGWQRQAAGTSIQGLLEEALLPIEKAPVTVHGAGRTDAGVHALGQVCSFTLTAAIEPAILVRALNAVLPPDVRVTDAEVMPAGFHARFSSTGKVYDYRIVHTRVVSPFARRYVWHVVFRLDVAAMKAAAALLVGEHDFAAFQASGAKLASTVRTVRRIDWSGEGSSEHPLVMQVEGDGFLRHMVRNMAGTLVDIGAGRWAPDAMAGILASRQRVRAGATAPAAGLFLRQVRYSAKITA